MSAVTANASDPLAKRIRDSMEQQHIGPNQLGRQIEERQGLSKGAGQRKLYRWRRGGQIQSADDAELLAELLDEPRDYFKEADGRRSRADDLAEISRKLDEVLQRVVETAAKHEARLAKLEERVGRLQKVTDRILKVNEKSFALLLGEEDESEQPPAASPAPPSEQADRPTQRQKRAS